MHFREDGSAKEEVCTIISVQGKKNNSTSPKQMDEESNRIVAAGQINSEMKLMKSHCCAFDKQTSMFKDILFNKNSSYGGL